MQNLEGWAISKERSSKGRSFHAETEKARRCIIAKQARGTKLTPRSRTQHPTCGQNRHCMTSRDREGMRGAARDTTGDHCSDTILYPLRYRQPMEYITHVGSGGRKLGQPNKTGSRTQNSVQPSQGIGAYQEEAQPAENSSSQYGWLQMHGQR